MGPDDPFSAVLPPEARPLPPRAAATEAGGTTPLRVGFLGGALFGLFSHLAGFDEAMKVLAWGVLGALVASPALWWPSIRGGARRRLLHWLGVADQR